MKKNLYLTGLTSIVLLQSFTVFSEYFVSISIIYILIVVVLITYNVYGLILQKALSECVSIILLMSCYLIFNDDLISLDFNSFNNSIVNDSLAYTVKFLICFFSAFYFLLISNSLKDQKLTSFEYILIVLFSILGLMVMCSSNDLLTSYLSIELSSLSLYILASFKKTSSYSIESGLKYFITGAISSSFFLLGSSLLYVYSGSICFDDFSCILYKYTPKPDPAIIIVDSELFRLLPVLKESPYVRLGYPLPSTNFINYVYYVPDIKTQISLEPFDTSFIEIGFTLILFSLFIKLACAPFHFWSLDVYEGSPTTSSFFFAAITKLSIFVLLIRFYYISLFSLYESCQFYCFWIGLMSIFVGSFGGLKQRKLKTLIAYSSITNMGYGVMALGATTNTGIQMLFFHLVIYTISGLCTWSILLFLRLKTKIYSNKYNKELCDLALLRKSNPALAFAFALTMFSIAGIPPMIGFLAKLGVFLTIISSNFIIFAIGSAIFSVVATFYYIRIIKVLYFENLLVGKLYHPIKSEKTIILSFLIFSLVLLFFNPSIIYLFSYKIIAKYALI